MAARRSRIGPYRLPIITNIAAAPRRQTARQDALLLQRFTHALSDLGGIVVQSKYDIPLEPLWARDEDAEAALEAIGGYPRFMRPSREPPAGDYGPLDAFAPIAGDAF